MLARIAAATGCNPAWLLTGIGDPWAVREPDAATGNAIMAEAEAAFRAACNLMVTAAPLTDGDTLPDELELDQLLLRVKTAIQQRHNELDANDPETDE